MGCDLGCSAAFPTLLILQAQNANFDGSDETEITKVHAASAADVDKAVAAAKAAFKNPTWRDMATTDRGELMFKLARLVEENKETLATIETWDNGTFLLSI